MSFLDPLFSKLLRRAVELIIDHERREIEASVRTIQFLLVIFEWTKVRALGQLQILTKASYTMLFVVPLMAACWPIVRGSLNRYNQSINEAQESAQKTIEELVLLAKENSNENLEWANLVATKIEQLEVSFQDIANNYVFTFENTNLPMVWVLAFSAALLVVVGHLIFQTFAPAEIRQHSQDEFVRKQLKNFQKSETEPKLTEAINIVADDLNISNEYLFAQISDPHGELPDLYGQPAEDSIPLLAVDYDDSPPIAIGPFTDYEQNLITTKKLSVVEMSARLNYARLATKNAEMALLASICYICSMILIGQIVFQQCKNILLAAGLM